MISVRLPPPRVVEVKRSKATSATTLSDVLCDHFHVVYTEFELNIPIERSFKIIIKLTGILEIVLSLLFIPLLSCIFV
jgi:hypothetical protein